MSSLWRWRVWAPIAVFGIQRSLLAVCACATGAHPFSAAAWIHWDSFIYLDLAEHGYRPPEACVVDGVAAFCGNAGWFPGYSALVALIGRLGAPLAMVAVGVSAVAQLATLVAFDLLLPSSLSRRERWLALLTAAFFAGNVYLAAAFPVSCFLCGALGALVFYRRGWNMGALVAAAFAAVCYPTGVLLGVAAGCAAVRPANRRLLWISAGALGGYALVLVTLRLTTGAWDSFYKVQATYGYHLQLPFDALGARLKPLVNRRYWDPKPVVTAFQALFVVLFLAALVRRGRELARTPEGPFLLGFAALFWLGPLMLGGRLALYRSEALLLPSALLLCSLPMAQRIFFAVAGVAIAIPMAVLFFQNVLV